MATIRKRRNVVFEAWHDLPPGGKVLVGAGAAFGVWRGYKAIKNSYESNQQKKELAKLSKEYNEPYVITSGKNQGVVVHVDLAKTATRLHDALNYGVMGWFVDVDAVKQALFAVPKPYMSSLEYIYKRVYGDDLEQKVKKALGPSILSKDDYAQVQYLFQ